MVQKFAIICLDSIDNEEYYTVYQQFVVTVTAVNDAPVITSVAPVSVFLGELYLYTIAVEDPDDDEFTYQNISTESEIEMYQNNFN